MTIKTQLNKFKTYCKQIVGTVPLSIVVFFSIAYPALANDPFRQENPRDIGEHTEKAFKTIFLEGDYKTVVEELKLAESEEAEEPLAHAMLASIAYTEEDWEAIKKYALKTLASAELLSETDPVRDPTQKRIGALVDVGDPGKR